MDGTGNVIKGICCSIKMEGTVWACYCILMLSIPILAAKIDYVFHTAMGRLVLLKHCVSVILWRFARCASGISSGTEHMEKQPHLFHHEHAPWQVMWQRTEQREQRWTCSIYAMQGGRRRSQGKPRQENPGSQSYRRGVWVISTNKKTRGREIFFSLCL